MYHETYEDLNNVKKKISQLMKMNFSETNERDFYDDTGKDLSIGNQFKDILDELKQATHRMYQMSTMTKQENGRRDRYYFRSTAVFMIFYDYANDMTYAIPNMIKKINHIMPDIGYVEPEVIKEFYETYNQYIANFILLRNVSFKNGVFEVVLVDNAHPNEIQRLTNMLTYIEQQNQELTKIVHKIDENYNYRTANTKTTKKDFFKAKIEQFKNDTLLDEE